MVPKTYPEAMELARDLYEDLSFDYVTQWKKQGTDRRVIGFLPIYVPREIIHAAGMLPVGIFGGGERVSVVKGDAFFQSYICHLPRTVIEMALDGNFKDFDGFLFPSICDVIRNLSGVFRLHFPQSFVFYLDFPQNLDPSTGGQFYRRQLELLAKHLEKLNGRRVTIDRLNRAIRVYNENRRLVKRLSDFRAQVPHRISAVDHYLVLRAGYIMSVEDHNDFLTRVLSILEKVDREPEDKIRVVISGSFCEQPPLGLIKTIENAGCYVVDDDFQLGSRSITGALADDTDDPLGVLVETYLKAGTVSSAIYDGDRPKEDAFARQVQNRDAQGVIFCAPSFCDPALLDRPRLEEAMDRHHIRHFSFQYHENLGQFHVIKEQAGTFADMIKLWE
ncbi:MAG: benzoyl-CoA reductase subunit C [Fidelibacterota bacterium]